jgi:hypothetical protein
MKKQIASQQQRLFRRAVLGLFCLFLTTVSQSEINTSIMNFFPTIPICSAFVIPRQNLMTSTMMITGKQMEQHQQQQQQQQIFPIQIKKRGNPKRGKIKDDIVNEEDDNFQRYNDDAFGLIFLIGGAASQDVDFAFTFLLLSAVAALGTSRGVVTNDPRVPGLVAISTLLVSPVVSSLRLTGSFDSISAPVPVEIGLCCVSMVVGLYNWKKEQQ